MARSTMGPARLPMLWQCLSLLMGVRGQQTLHLVSTVPATDGDFLAGFSVIVGTEIMLEYINNNPALLPGVSLNILWQDDRCSAERGTHIFLQNVFDETYEMLAPGVPLTKLDHDRDGTISGADTEIFKRSWNSTQVQPRPVAVLSGTCSGVTGSMVNVAYYANLPIVSGVATFGGLSDRSRYLNFFRTCIPDSQSTYAWVKLVQLLNHSSMAVVSSLGDWALTVADLTRFAAQHGMELVGKDHSNNIPGFRGVLLSTDESTLTSSASGSFSDGATQLVRMKQRVVVVLQYVPFVQRLLCEAYKSGFTTAVWVAIGWLEYGWWDMPAGSCSAAEMRLAARWTILGKMSYWRLDSDTRLACAPDATSGQLHREWFARQNATFGDLSKLPAGYSLYDDAASQMDALCMYALALHELIHVRGVGVDALVRRDEATYRSFQEVLTATDFEGLTGRVRFKPGVADAEASVQLEQLQENKPKIFGMYTAGVVTFLDAEIRFHFQGETGRAVKGASSVNVPLQRYANCPPGEKVDFASNTCRRCPANTTYVAGFGDCLCSVGFYVGNDGCAACPAGTFSAVLGSMSCDACEPGKSAVLEASTGCQFCERGSFSSERGASECSTCPPWQTTAAIARESAEDCECRADAYRLPNTSTCAACPANATTTPSHNVGVQSCRCVEGTFMSADFSRCEMCPPSADTDGPGHSSVSRCLCPAGSFLSMSQQCLPCPEHMTCPMGSNAANRRFLAIAPGERGRYERFLEVEPGYWANAEEPWKLFTCRSKSQCPGGSPGFACAPRLVGLACEHCEDGYKWSGSSCVLCAPSQRNPFVFPILPLMLLFAVILAAYKIFGDPFPRWGSWQNSCTVLLFIALNHYQILGTLSQQNITFPAELEAFLRRYQSTNSESLGFGLDCVGLGTLFPAMLARTIAPAVVVLATATIYYTSRWLAKVMKNAKLHLDRDRLINVLGSFMFTFFGAISAMSLTLFMCLENPSGEETLTVDMSVVCYDDPKWLRGLGLGLICVFLYILGMGSCFLYIIYIAPRHFKDPGFQMRWKFLFIKFHSGAYWWGMIFLLKNFGINFVPVIVRAEFSKLYLSMTVIMFYLAGVVAVMPYRVTVANIFDLVVGVCLLYSAALLTWWIGTRFPTFDSVALGTMLLTLVPILYLPLGLIYLYFNGKKARPTKAQLLAAELEFRSLANSFGSLASLKQCMGLDLLLRLSEGDRHTLKAADLVIRTDILGIASAQRVSTNSTPLVLPLKTALAEEAPPPIEVPKPSKFRLAMNMEFDSPRSSTGNEKHQVCPFQPKRPPPVLPDFKV